MVLYQVMRVFWKVPGFLVIFRNQPDFFSTWDGRQQLPIFWARGLQRCLAAQCAKLPQLLAKTWSKVGNFSKNSVIFERIHDNSSINGLAPVSSWFGWFCNRFNIQFEDDLGQKHYVHQRGTQGRLAHLLTWKSFFTWVNEHVNVQKQRTCRFLDLLYQNSFHICHHFFGHGKKSFHHCGSSLTYPDHCPIICRSTVAISLGEWSSKIDVVLSHLFQINTSIG